MGSAIRRAPRCRRLVLLRRKDVAHRLVVARWLAVACRLVVVLQLVGARRLVMVRRVDLARRQHFRGRLPRSPWTQRRDGWGVHGGYRRPAFSGRGLHDASLWLICSRRRQLSAAFRQHIGRWRRLRATGFTAAGPKMCRVAAGWWPHKTGRRSQCRPSLTLMRLAAALRRHVVERRL